jgi:hypothetical protein
MSHNRWWKLGALGGIVFVVLQIVSQMLMDAGDTKAPFDASSATILKFFQDRDPQLYGLGDYLATLSIIPFLWFLGTLWSVLRRAGQDYHWLVTTAMVLGVLAMTFFISGGGWTLAVGRVDDGLSEEQARLLFDEGNLGFANTFVPIGGMLLSIAVIIWQAGVLPRWNGGLAAVAGVGLLLARAVWATSQVIFIPYILYWLWLSLTSITLFRRSPE